MGRVSLSACQTRETSPIWTSLGAHLAKSSVDVSVGLNSGAPLCLLGRFQQIQTSPGNKPNDSFLQLLPWDGPCETACETSRNNFHPLVCLMKSSTASRILHLEGQVQNHSSSREDCVQTHVIEAQLTGDIQTTWCSGSSSST